MDAWKNNDDMRAALADASNGTRDAPSGDWGEKTQNDYNEDNEGVAWEANARVYEWDGEGGEIGPVHQELEIKLFGDPNTRDPQGIDFSV